jgi:hypothetical protein
VQRYRVATAAGRYRSAGWESWRISGTRGGCRGEAARTRRCVRPTHAHTLSPSLSLSLSLSLSRAPSQAQHGRRAAYAATYLRSHLPLTHTHRRNTVGVLAQLRPAIAWDSMTAEQFMRFYRFVFHLCKEPRRKHMQVGLVGWVGARHMHERRTAPRALRALPFRLHPHTRTYTPTCQMPADVRRSRALAPRSLRPPPSPLRTPTHTYPHTLPAARDGHRAD